MSAAEVGEGGWGGGGGWEEWEFPIMRRSLWHMGAGVTMEETVVVLAGKWRRLTLFAVQDGGAKRGEIVVVPAGEQHYPTAFALRDAAHFQK